MYDVVIIGGGISGLMAAYNLRQKNKDISIAIIEQGKPLDKRKCPANDNQSCVHCDVCSITKGYAGAGAFSDGKFNIGTSYGGTLGEELGEDIAMEYINQSANIIADFFPKNVNTQEYLNDKELEVKCLQNDLQLLKMTTWHLGTENNYIAMGNLITWLSEHNVKLINGTAVEYILTLNSYYSVETDNRGLYFTKNVIVATGRGGSELVKTVCKNYDIPIKSNAVDVGVRVEMKDDIWKEFSEKIYEPKIVYKTPTFEDKTRMFCFNQGGIVSAENNNGVITANGHSYADKSKKTDNCNFAILSSINFTEPFNQPTEYAKNISMMANMVGNGNVIVQRFGDLIRGRRTTDRRLAQNTVQPTLKATAGDLSLVLPHRILTNIIETIYALDKVAKGTANDDTLLYGCEAKYYSIQPKHNENFEILDNIYLIGDGSGICRGLSQSAAMGLYVADKILEKHYETSSKT